MVSIEALRACLVAAAAGFALASCVPAAAPPHATAYGYVQSVSSGRLALMGDYGSISGDGARSCRAERLPVIRITVEPAHGEAIVSEGERPVHARRGQKLAYCNGRLFPSRIVQYRSLPGYRGADHLTYQVGFADGTTDIYEKSLTVR
jgi:hypothetical protein